MFAFSDHERFQPEQSHPQPYGNIRQRLPQRLKNRVQKRPHYRTRWHGNDTQDDEDHFQRRVNEPDDGKVQRSVGDPPTQRQEHADDYGEEVIDGALKTRRGIYLFKNSIYMYGSS